MTYFGREKTAGRELGGFLECAFDSTERMRQLQRTDCGSGASCARPSCLGEGECLV